jgi:hypothetical protein
MKHGYYMAHYRYIRVGEILRLSDEFHSSNDGTWISFRRFYGELWKLLGYDTLPLRRSRGQVAMRRRIVRIKCQ